jgi:hypothetical protein
MGRPKGTIRRLADETSLDQATVRRALTSSGMTERDAEADFAKAVEVVKAVADADRIIGHAVNGRGEGVTSNVFAEVKAEEARHRIEKMRLQNERLRGSLVDRADVTDTLTRMLADLRTVMLAVSGKLAPGLAGQTDARTIGKIIDAAIRDALTVFADEQFFAALEKEAFS